MKTPLNKKSYGYHQCWPTMQAFKCPKCKSRVYYYATTGDYECSKCDLSSAQLENERYNKPCPHNPEILCVQYPDDDCCGCDPCEECENGPVVTNSAEVENEN